MRKFLLALLVLAVIISGCISNKELTVITKSGQVKIKVEIADTDEKRQIGLMYREKLGENEGMIFVFDQEQPVTFWMKNTLIPLDMIFVSSNGTINEIKENVQPCFYEPCILYPSKHPSKYVIEVNANFSRKNNIQIGDVLNVNNFN